MREESCIRLLKFYNQQIVSPIHCKCSTNHFSRPKLPDQPLFNGMTFGIWLLHRDLETDISAILHLLNPAKPTSKLLGLASSVIRDQQRSVVLNQRLLQQVLGVLIDELLIVSDNGLGDGLTDGVDLRCVSTTSDPDADVDVGEFLETDNQEGFVNLESKDLRLDEIERLSINLYDSFSRLCILSVCHPLRSPGGKVLGKDNWICRNGDEPGQG
jgi:hypothetical protein